MVKSPELKMTTPDNINIKSPELKMTTPDNINKVTKVDIEKILSDELVEKFGKRFQDYREKYQRNLQDKSHSFLPNYPTTVILELVNRCNLECVMCYQGFRNRAGKSTIDNDTLNLIFDDFKKNNLESLMLSISEPLLYKDFDKVLEKAKSAGIMDIFLFTNGTLLNKKNAEIILSSSVSRLFISIDAATSNKYNAVRIPVSKRLKNQNRLIDLENNIKNFMKLKNEKKQILPIVRTSFVAITENHQEISKFVDKWKNIVDSVEIQRETSIDAYDDIKAGNIINSEKKLEKYDCNEPWGQISIYSDGTVAPCCNIVGRNLPIGNIKNNTISEIWNGEAMKKIRESFINNNPNKVCKACIENSQSTLYKSF